MSRPTIAKIHLTALAHNVSRIAAIAPRSRILAVVKANAYGHNAPAIAAGLSNVAAMGVACLEEALLLRQAGVTQPIVLLEGFFSADELPLIAAENLDIVIHAFWQIETLIQYGAPWKTRVWLKMNTGMNRLGLPMQDYLRAYGQLSRAGILTTKPILMSHFACSDELDNPLTQQQYTDFHRACSALTGEFSLANSAAIIAHPYSHHDWVRPGLMLYGVSPIANQSAASLALRPVMTLTSRIIAIQHCRAGETIGYGSAFTCPEAMRVGVVAIGYADGYPREIAPNTPVVVNGQRTVIVGRVSMDMLTVDLRGLHNVELGADVELWGAQLPIETIAVAAHTIPYTLLVGIAQRVKHAIFS